jgi:flagellar hook capping protein FlgD
VCVASGGQASPAIAPDGQGGAFVAWSDSRAFISDIYAQHLTAAGNFADGWVADGAAICTASGNQTSPAVAADGQGGALVTWRDQRSGAAGDIYAARVAADGPSYVGWPANGRAVSTATSEQQNPVVIGDGEGNGFVAWSDNRVVGGTIGVQRVDHYGVLGDPAPLLSGIRDVPNDEGGKVRVAWNASWLDQPVNNPIASYWVLRSVPAAEALRALAAGTAVRLDQGTAAASDGRRALVFAAQAFWELVATTPSLSVSQYGLVAQTTGDSSALGNPSTSFMVQARTTTGLPFWASAPDSGYSVDNLAPAAPGGLAGTFAGGVASLAWHPGGEPDLAFYHVYRGTSLGFEVGPQSLIGTVSDPHYTDPVGAAAAYAVTAIDTHGNESAPSRIIPSGALAVGERAAVLSLEAPRPTPSVGHAELSFTLPRAGHARLDVIDAAGRQVRTLANGSLGAGSHEVRWDGRGTHGELARPGIYLVRLSTEAGARVVRLLLTR